MSWMRKTQKQFCFFVFCFLEHWNNLELQRSNMTRSSRHEESSGVPNPRTTCLDLTPGCRVFVNWPDSLVCDCLLFFSRAEPFKHTQTESTHRPSVYLLVQDQSSGGPTGRRRGSTGTVYSPSLLNRGNNHHPIVERSKRDQMFGAEEALVALCPGSSDKHVRL